MSRETPSAWEASVIPAELERSASDTDSRVLVKWRTKWDPLGIILIAKESFRGLVKSFGNVVDRVGASISGAPEFLWPGVSAAKNMLHGPTYPPEILLPFGSQRPILQIYL